MTSESRENSQTAHPAASCEASILKENEGGYEKSLPADKRLIHG